MRRSMLVALALGTVVVAAAVLWRSRDAARPDDRRASVRTDARSSDGARAPADSARQLPARRRPLEVTGELADEPGGAARPPGSPVGVTAGDEIHRQYQAAHEASVLAARGCELGDTRALSGNPVVRLRYQVAYRDGEAYVTSVELLESSFRNPTLDACVKDGIAASRWRAAMPDGAMDAPFEDELGLDELR